MFFEQLLPPWSVVKEKWPTLLQCPSRSSPTMAGNVKAGGSSSSTSRAEKPPSASAPSSATDDRGVLAKRKNGKKKKGAGLDRQLSAAEKVQQEAAEVLGASQQLDNAWDDFQARFDAVNQRLIEKVRESLESGLDPLENFQRRDDDYPDSDASSSTDDGIADDDKLRVFGGGAPSLDILARKMKAGEFRKVVVMAGAGISVSAGIPDFRSKGGLYDQVRAKYPDMSQPELMFDIGYFKENPMPFTLQAKAMCPGKFKPTRTHLFFRLLSQKKLLSRVYTQNIDTMEKLTGLKDKEVVYAHGSFADVHCIECGKQMPLAEWREKIEEEKIPRCQGPRVMLRRNSSRKGNSRTNSQGGPSSRATSRSNGFSPTPSKDFGNNPSVSGGLSRCSSVDSTKKCGSLVKPDIVFFGEPLPARFHQLHQTDLGECDLLLVFGTSLKVAPFNLLIGNCGKLVPRVLINNEMAGTRDRVPGGFRFGEEESRFGDGLRAAAGKNSSGKKSSPKEELPVVPKNYRDLFLQGSCDDMVTQMVQAFGWTAELEKLEKEFASEESDGWRLMLEGQHKCGLALRPSYNGSSP